MLFTTKKRQLIFTSHNANLVVNGDAELVICCDYKDSNSQTRGIVKVEGAIDTRAVKNEITAVMEGGEKAFQGERHRRKARKYCCQTTQLYLAKR